MAGRSLDVAETQVAVDFFDDPHYHWHMRILLINGGGGKWIWVTPDDSVQYADLSVHRVVPVQRAAPFPARLAGNLYAFDLFEDGELEDIRTQAVALAAVLGLEVPKAPGTAAPRWVVSDPAHEEFGTVVDAGIRSAEDRFV